MTFRIKEVQTILGDIKFQSIADPPMGNSGYCAQQRLIARSNVDKRFNSQGFGQGYFPAPSNSPESVGSISSGLTPI